MDLVIQKTYRDFKMPKYGWKARLYQPMFRTINCNRDKRYNVCLPRMLFVRIKVRLRVGLGAYFTGTDDFHRILAAPMGHVSSSGMTCLDEDRHYVFPFWYKLPDLIDIFWSGSFRQSKFSWMDLNDPELIYERMCWGWNAEQDLNVMMAKLRSSFRDWMIL